MLLGEYEHTIDDKNRLTLPAKFRREFDDGIVVTRGFDGCVWAWTLEGWENYRESTPIRTTVGVETAVETARDDDPLGEGLPELGRKGEAVLVIDRVLVLAEEHRWGLLGLPLRPPLYPTIYHL